MDYQKLRDYELDIILKAWQDEDFRVRLLKDPKQAIEEEFSILVPQSINIFVHEEDEHRIHLIVPSKPANFNTQKMSEGEILHKIQDLLSSHHETR